jgi:hypothetical protein
MYVGIVLWSTEGNEPLKIIVDTQERGGNIIIMADNHEIATPLILRNESDIYDTIDGMQHTPIGSMTNWYPGTHESIATVAVRGLHGYICAGSLWSFNQETLKERLADYFLGSFNTRNMILQQIRSRLGI